ncbi:MAG TPA: VCBS repeat-containing protein, partial [Chthoniobacterales bacterium]|nr:VCBS repeat-containing protein [Chthoniobacterales bacterium]
MNIALTLGLCSLPRFTLAMVGLFCLAGAVRGADRPTPRVNFHGSPVRDVKGKGINYSREQLPAVENVAASPNKSAHSTANVAPQGFVPSENPVRPFWQYSIFGSGIGLSNIVIGPAVAGSGSREIIIGGNSRNDFGADDFWQVIQRNAITGNYDQRFVSPIYSTEIKRIALGNVVGDAKTEIAVMLTDGRIYLYDFATRTELGYLNLGVSATEGLSLTDLNGDGMAEFIVTTADDLLVFNGGGNLLWQAAGAGGSEVVAGQMDNDPALEIATTKGIVTDAGTHAVQWTRSAGFGSHLKLAPLPGRSYQQLIAAEAWQHVYAYDVATRLPRWSINTPQDIGAIEVADVDHDGTPEVIVGDDQWGRVRVHDLITQAEKWAADNPEHGVTNIAVGDIDNDGVVDLLWGAGWTSTGADFLYVASTTGTHAIKWQSVDLQGPFIGPVIGDLDGDGQPELVICSSNSESGGRILVFDPATFALRGMSAPVLDNSTTAGVTDLKLRDLEGDGRMEIVLAGDYLYDGAIEIYEFDSANTFDLKWTNTTRPSGSPFSFVDVADLDGNGTAEIIAGNSVAHTGSPGVYLYIFDYPSRTNPWQSVNLASDFNSVTGLVVADLDGNGSKEIAALVSTGDLYTFDGPTRDLKSLVQQPESKIISRGIPSGLVTGDSTGKAHFLQYSNNSYTESFSRQLGASALDGIHVLDNGELWTGSDGVLSRRLPPAYNLLDWHSPLFGTGFGRFVATDFRNGQTHVFSSAQHAVAGFQYTSSPPALASTLGNISTRGRVETNDQVLIGGFIVSGTLP